MITAAPKQAGLHRCLLYFTCSISLAEAGASVNLKLNLMRLDGSMIASKELTVQIDTAAGCPARRDDNLQAEGSSRLHWMPLGFDVLEDDGRPFDLHSMHSWLTEFAAEVSRIDSDQIHGLGAGDTLVLVLNALDPTVPHQMERLLAELRQLTLGSAVEGLGRGRMRVGAVHLGDSSRAAGRHFYPPLDFVLRSYCRGMWGPDRGQGRPVEVCLAVDLGASSLLRMGESAGGTTPEEWVEAPEYQWAFIGAAALRLWLEGLLVLLRHPGTAGIVRK